MLPFTVDFETGEPVFEQIISSVKRAVLTGVIQEGDPFPSPRVLSQELRISPISVRKAITLLEEQGILKKDAKLGRVVDKLPQDLKQARTHLLDHQIEKLIEDARKLNLSLDELHQSIAKHWEPKK